MQVDQISSAAQKEEHDSEAEEEQIAFNKSKFTLEFDFDTSKITSGLMVLVCSGKFPQALMRIIFNDELVEMGKISAN